MIWKGRSALILSLSKNRSAKNDFNAQSPGLSVLELLISITLAALLSTLIFNIFYQQHNTILAVEEHEDVDVSTAVVLRQLAHDLAGVWQPISVTEAKKTVEKAEGAQEQEKESTPVSGTKIRELTFKPLTNAFVATEKNNQLDELTFITENPLHRFVTPLPSVPPKPQMVRVMYQFKDKKLLRSEAVVNTKTGAQATKTQPIVVAENITSMVCTFMYTTSSDKEHVLNEQSNWDSNLFFASLLTKTQKEQDKTAKQNPIPKIPPLPSMVKVRITLFDKLQRRQHSYSYLIPVPTATFAHQAGITILQPPMPKPKENNAPLAQLRQPGGMPQIFVRTPQRAQLMNNLTTGLSKAFGLAKR